MGHEVHRVLSSEAESRRADLQIPSDPIQEHVEAAQRLHASRPLDEALASLQGSTEIRNHEESRAAVTGVGHDLGLGTPLGASGRVRARMCVYV